MKHTNPDAPQDYKLNFPDPHLIQNAILLDSISGRRTKKK